MTDHKPRTSHHRYPDEMPFPELIWDQSQHPERGWERDVVWCDPVARAVLDVLDHWRRNQDSEVAIELLERAIITLRWYQGVPPKRAAP